MNKNCNFVEKLRDIGLRPTKQRVKICKVLFLREKTFHFTINDLVKKISHEMSEKISLATVYNTVHAFQKKGYLKEISINSNKSYFDTNTSAHYHFYDEDTHELIDCDENDIDSINLKKNITGKKVNSVEVLIRVESDNQNHN
jgi:Fur family transcriptional regulator, iron response regulator